MSRRYYTDIVVFIILVLVIGFSVVAGFLLNLLNKSEHHVVQPTPTTFHAEYPGEQQIQTWATINGFSVKP